MHFFNRFLVIQSKYHERVLDVLSNSCSEAHQVARLVGGCVRDSLIGKNNVDIDIATSLLPDQVIEKLQSANIKVVPTGIKFGTVTAFIEDEKFEITTLRRDVECDGRRAIVAFSDNFMEDAIRRDFTINALSYSPIEGVVYDYCGGVEDLLHSRVVFIGDPALRVQEDYLRILRFFRFSCYYSTIVDPISLEVCARFKDKLLLISKERILGEMDRILASDNAPRIVEIMHQYGILSRILPTITSFLGVVLSEANIAAKNLSLNCELFAKYVILFYDAKISLSALIDLRFARKIAQNILLLIGLLKSSQDPVLIARELWANHSSLYEQYIIIAVAFGMMHYGAAQELLEKYSVDIKRPNFPINGRDIIKLGISGAEINILLTKIKNQWIDSHFTLTREELLSMLLQEI